MGVAEDPLPKKLQVPAHLGVGIKPPAGVVEIDLPCGVVSAIVTRPQLIESTSRTELGIRLSKAANADA